MVTLELDSVNLDKSLGLHSLKIMTLGIPSLRDDLWTGFNEPGQVSWTDSLKTNDPVSYTHLTLPTIYSV